MDQGLGIWEADGRRSDALILYSTPMWTLLVVKDAQALQG